MSNTATTDSMALRMTPDLACILLVLLEDPRVPWTSGDLADRTGCKQITGSRILGYLHQCGLVTVTTSADPFQICSYRLTDDGITQARIALKYSYGRDPGIVLLACSVQVPMEVVSRVNTARVDPPRRAGWRQP